MKNKNVLISFLLALITAFFTSCSQTTNDPDINTDVGTSLTETQENTSSVENTDKEPAVTVISSDSEPEESITSGKTDNPGPTSSTPSSGANNDHSSSKPNSTGTVNPPASSAAASKTNSAVISPSVSKTKPAAPAPVTKPTTTTTSNAAKPSVTTTTSTVQKPVSSAGFYVNGTSLYDANGNRFVMRGINHAHTWFKSQLETAIPAIAATGSNTVRIVLSDGQQYTKDSISDVKRIIEICKKNKLVCILEVHDVTGKNDINGLRRVTDYWLEIKSALIGNEAYVILNIANEWVGDWDSATWYKGYSEAIKAIRNAGIKNAVIIDSAGWGQYAESINHYGQKLLNDDPQKNTLFSVHMYGTAGKNPDIISKNIKYATNNNLCVIVGEFGHTHSDGDVDEDYIMEYCNKNNIGYLGWSWKGNGGGVEYLDIANDWNGNSLSGDWGEKLINGIYGIKNTSKICSVYK